MAKQTMSGSVNWRKAKRDMKKLGNRAKLLVIIAPVRRSPHLTAAGYHSLRTIYNWL